MRTLLIATATLSALLSACKSAPPEAMPVNTVTRSYSKPMSEVWPAVVGTMRELELTMDANRSDALGGQITALRANQDAVRIEGRAKDGPATELSVAVEPGDRTMAQLVQDRIAEKLGATSGVARTGFVAGNRVEGQYRHGLDNCMEAGKRALAALKMDANVRPERHDVWAKLETRHADAFPVEIRMERTDRDLTRVTFMVGTGPADDNRLLAQRLKTEFERQLQP